jgi:hypothetical protein
MQKKTEVTRGIASGAMKWAGKGGFCGGARVSVAQHFRKPGKESNNCALKIVGYIGVRISWIP